MNAKLQIKYGQDEVMKSKMKALSALEDMPIEDELDQKKQELVLRGIKSQLANDCIVDLSILQAEFIEANYIKDDVNYAKATSEFRDVIMFFVGCGILKTISLNSIKMMVDVEAFNRAYRKVENKIYTIGTRK